MTAEEVVAQFEGLYGKFQNIVLMETRPKLSHYTSIDVLEKIMRTDEVWFSCPLFMNDLQEMRFGVLEGAQIFEEVFGDPAFVSECDHELISSVKSHFHGAFQQFDQQHALDVFVFCLSEHDDSNADGLLSMWRGYGAHGNGAAIVFNTDFMTARQNSPLLIAKVVYASDEERREMLRGIAECGRNILLEGRVPLEFAPIVAGNIFYLMKLNALLNKHHGFAEEREWRIIYLPDLDVEGLLKGGFSYVVGANGVEPKLKFPIRPLAIEDPNAWNLESIVEKIILGPSLSSGAAANSIRRMLRTLGKTQIAEKVIPSGIPLRPLR